MKRQISIINEPDWSENMAATDQCIFAMGGPHYHLLSAAWAQIPKSWNGPEIWNLAQWLEMMCNNFYYKPSQPDGGAVTKAWKCIFGKAMPLTP